MRWGSQLAREYPDVVDTVSWLRDLLAKILGHHLVGLYLTGSLAAGDFDPPSSDIDFVAILDDAPGEEQVHHLQRQYEVLRKGGRYWASRVEGLHLPLDMCVQDGARLLRYYELVLTGAVEYCEPTCQWLLQLHLTRRNGVVLVGPPPALLLPEIPPEDVRQAAGMDVMALVPDIAGLQPARKVAYRVLLLCRMLYAQAHGEVVSKPAAAIWALDRLDRRWSSTIEWALEARSSDEVIYGYRAQEFVRHVRPMIRSLASQDTEVPL